MKKSLPAIAMIILCISGGHAHGADSVGAPPLSADSTQIPVKITGGHETDPRDGGRPVILIASALKVTPDVFRNVFSNVHPSHNGGPTDEEARANKRVLLDGLGPYGITDDRINEVSNYYRYAKWRGQMWRTREATALATVSHGVVTGFNVTDPGSGYSSPPEASIPGYPNVSVQVTLAFGTNFTSNGSIKEMKLVNGAAGASQPPVRSSSDASTEGERRPAPRNRPPGGGPIQRALDQLHLSDDEARKVEPLMKEYREKEKQLRDEISDRLKGVLSPDRFDQFETGMRQPPPPPPEANDRPAQGQN